MLNSQLMVIDFLEKNYTYTCTYIYAGDYNFQHLRSQIATRLITCYNNYKSFYFFWLIYYMSVIKYIHFF